MSKIKELLEVERIEDTSCPRCDFAKALFQYNAFNLQDETVFCFRCGYSSYSGIKLDHDLSFSASTAGSIAPQLPLACCTSRGLIPT
jgi:hypothetical protein